MGMKKFSRAKVSSRFHSAFRFHRCRWRARSLESFVICTGSGCLHSCAWIARIKVRDFNYDENSDGFRKFHEASGSTAPVHGSGHASECKVLRYHPKNLTWSTPPVTWKLAVHHKKHMKSLWNRFHRLLLKLHLLYVRQSNVDLIPVSSKKRRKKTKNQSRNLYKICTNRIVFLWRRNLTYSRAFQDKKLQILREQLEKFFALEFCRLDLEFMRMEQQLEWQCEQMEWQREDSRICELALQVELEKLHDNS